MSWKRVKKMIRLTVTKTICDHGASIFTASPSEICLGGMDASGVDVLHVDVPEDWKDCVIRATFIPSLKKSVAKLLDDNGNVWITSDITGRAAKGVIIIDAVRDGYAAYTQDVLWTTYTHGVVGSGKTTDAKTEYEQMVDIMQEIKAGIPDDDLLGMLAETDVLPAVTDASGAILTDDQGKTLMM